MLCHHTRSVFFSYLDLTTATLLLLLLCCGAFTAEADARRRRASASTVVVDERLAVLRAAPDLSADVLRRLGRGRAVTITGARRTAAGVMFYRVGVSRRTSGWLQREAVASVVRPGDDARLLRLIRASAEFERLARARIFLELFPASNLRPAVLLLYADAAQEAAAKLARDAARRLSEDEARAGGAPLFSYFMNYNGLDRWRKQGVVFTFNPATKQFHYDGTAWREILRRYPRSPEAREARHRLDSLPAVGRDTRKSLE